MKEYERVYLDYASATPIVPSALEAYVKSTANFGNPGSIHAEGVVAKAALLEAREHIAAQLGAKSRQLIFTSGGTEANNLAIVGYARHLEQMRALAGTHWIVSAIEHPSVLECFGEVERLGGVVEYLECSAKGLILPEVLERALRKETVFVSIGWVNHEIGTIQPIPALARVIRAHEEAHGSTVLLHSDAGQGALYRAAQVHTLGVDLFSLDSGKMYAPRGLGVLYLSNRTQLAPVLFGGKQERALRPGTENGALVAAFAEAFAQIAGERESEARRLTYLRDELADRVLAAIPGAVVNGDLDHSSPHLLNISIPDIQSEYVTLALDHMGIALSTKSACREGEEQISHVVAALHGEEWRAKSSLRFSLGRQTAEADIKRAADVLAEVVNVRHHTSTQ